MLPTANTLFASKDGLIIGYSSICSEQIGEGLTAVIYNMSCRVNLIVEARKIVKNEVWPNGSLLDQRPSQRVKAIAFVFLECIVNSVLK
jgi:hypothetical protein